ncbi:hypothetical protein MMAN_33090 [Mycobacterium mantenii]|uniref:TetR family transcriptional regulator n=1 Tax=Mycobacterium mantenii TaxID=560555 RepID=A0ABN6ACP7_MYCNT|nr:hypothetical protein MMAN_33090 [Mycobacterium mantenii]
MLLRAGAADASLRADVQAHDVVSSLIGIFLASRSPEQTGRMLDLLVAGVLPSSQFPPNVTLGSRSRSSVKLTSRSAKP